MKIKTLITLFVFISTIAISQDYLDDIAIKSCECLSNIADTLSSDQYNLELGLCMIEASSPYAKQLKKDYRIDLNKIDKHGGK